MTTTSHQSLASAWTLDPEIHFLNHGSFGATPREVLEHQSALRARIEREPVRWLARELQGEIDAAREVLAGFLCAAPEDLGPVPNATTGVNAVLRSLRFQPGDQLLCTSQGYNACANTLRFVAERWGAEVVVADVPFPVSSEDEAFEAVLSAVGERTRFVLIDHVTSPTAVVLPVERIARALQDHPTLLMVDGAHAPGMLALDLDAIGKAGVDYYTGNCHKWLCAPKGAAFLWARRDRQEGLRPTVISHGANANASSRSRFQLEFDWIGTDDPTAFLSVPRALECVGGLVAGGWDEVRAHNHALVLEGRAILCEGLGIAPPVPDGMIGSIASVPLPQSAADGPADAFTVDPQQLELYGQFRIEVPIFPWPAPPRRLLRISAQLYNTRADYESLAQALTTLLA